MVDKNPFFEFITSRGIHKNEYAEYNASMKLDFSADFNPQVIINWLVRWYYYF